MMQQGVHISPLAYECPSANINRVSIIIETLIKHFNSRLTLASERIENSIVRDKCEIHLVRNQSFWDHVVVTAFQQQKFTALIDPLIQYMYEHIKHKHVSLSRTLTKTVWNSTLKQQTHASIETLTATNVEHTF